MENAGRFLATMLYSANDGWRRNGWRFRRLGDGKCATVFYKVTRKVTEPYRPSSPASCRTNNLTPNAAPNPWAPAVGYF